MDLVAGKWYYSYSSIMNYLGEDVNNLKHNSIIKEIENEYAKIENKWLNLHYKTFIGLVLFGLFVEAVMGAKLFISGYIEISLLKYVLKYMLAPFLFNCCLIAVGIWSMYSGSLQLKTKIYTISLLLVGVCLVFSSVHSIFEALYVIFTVPILLTVVYGDYILTSVTAFLSITAKIISELFIVWDADKANPFDSELGIINFIISVCILLAFYVASIVVIRFEKEKNSASIQKEIERHQIQQKLLTDELTDIYNRTALREEFQNMENDTIGNTYALVMIDLDNFKMLNDTMGHDKGDQCLREFGRILKNNCADSLPFRFGGDEFCILFKNKTIEQIKDICEKIQNDLKVSDENKSSILLTASIGIASFTRQISARQLLRNTDKALYHSKKMKDSICMFDDIE